MALPRRKRLRLPDYNYSRNGCYFVTICAHQRRNLFSHIAVGQGIAPAEVQLTTYGNVAQEQLLALEERYKSVNIDKYIIMPNHIHLIVAIGRETAGASPCPTLSQVIGAYKSLVTRMCKKIEPIDRVFQTSFYDHIICGEQDYREIWEYIDNNPAKWQEDTLYQT